MLLHTPLPKSPGQRSFWQLPPGAALALAATEAARRHEGMLVVASHDGQRARRLRRELTFFASDLHIDLFPDWETLPYDRFSPHPDIISQRIASLYRLPAAERGILVVPVATLMQRLAPRSYITGSGLAVESGQRMVIEHEQQRLQAAGYRHVSQVAEPGDFAVRGGLIDIYPMGAPLPYRIELLDEEVDSIRSFDAESQRSIQPVDAIRLLPAREYPTTEEAARNFRSRLRERFPIDVRRCPLYQDMRQGVAPSGIEYYLPLFFEHTETLFDYLPDDALLLLDRGAMDAAESFWQQTAERHEQRAHDVERPILPPAEIYLPPDALRQELNRRHCIELVEAGHRHAVDTGSREAPSVPLKTTAASGHKDFAAWLAGQAGRVLVAADTAGRRETLGDQIAALGARPESVAGWQEFLRADKQVLAITVGELGSGFAVPDADITVLTEHELLGEQARRSRRRAETAASDPDAIIRDLSELEPGAPIVHVDHGVGRYRGLERLEVGDSPDEFLAIEYAKGAKLYVPVAQLGLVSRYTGTTPELAPLHSLGGEAWQRAKRKAAEKVRDVAAELLAIHAQRAARQGRALVMDEAMNAEFAAQFPFEETPDQQQAIDAVLADLAAPQPMDRVVCGDVGFGKTEVALRAAFATATAGRQVAVLVPTTLLAQQHYDSFRDRFAEWPIEVDALSRFQSPKETARTLERMQAGEVDVVIGTHKLLQGKLKFKDLGLVIVDEEQRFGVRQKEQLKKLRAEVDLLTLTATPIPRTLNMAMSGMRDLSIIATAPAHRVAVKTVISQYDPAMVREALQRELARGGQVYFLHNQVESIERAARELGELMPEARIRIAHGQMPERELEQVMLDFHRQRFNLLVCTTIIESGIDIPTANTIIINRADRFGLAQLHQLRGRVGRSHHRAYAYLIVPHRKAMTSDARKRLEALASLEELGAGFTLATHDMEIRGAGELLGEDQSGQIQEIGFSLYSDLLERAVKALKDGKVPDFDLSSASEAEIELHLPALIPDDYLPDVHARLTLYKRIASCADEDALRAMQVEMIDRFGLLPEASKNLFAITALKLKATALGIRKLDLGAEGGRIVFSDKPAVHAETIIGMVQSQPETWRMDGADTLRVRQELPHAAQRLEFAAQLLQRLAAS